ncbi:MAG: hypothetical protein ACE5JH_05080 [Acidobacteriota bacterium]
MGDAAALRAERAKTLAARGERQAAAALAARLAADPHLLPTAWYHLAGIHARLGEAHRALDYLDRLIEERAPRCVLLGLSAVLDSLHGESRFRAVAARVGLAIPGIGAPRRAAATAGSKRTGRRLATGSKLNHYVIVDRLGEGGMGQVYVAEDGKLRRRAALKVMSPEIARVPRRSRRF